jgi:hypothetical protein
MSTQPSITWTNLNNLGQTTSPTLVQTFKSVQTVVQTASDVLNVVEQFIKIASIFLSSPNDLIGTFLQGGILLFDSIIKGLMSTGGSAILITPFNRMHPRNYNFLSDNPKDYPSFSLPAMTIKESIDEFRISFSNTLDIGRPTWGKTDHALGVGIIITCPELPSFTAVMKSITLLFNFDDFKQTGEKYEKMMHDQAADLNLQYKTPPKWSGPNIDALLQPLYEVFPYKDSVTGKLQTSNYSPVSGALNPNSKKINYSGTLPKLHWVGLNLYNFPFFQQIMSMIDETVAHLLTMVASTDSAIAELAGALIKRVEVIKQLITQFLSAAESLVMSINNVDILTFRVESFTGVSGILSAIDSSAQSVPAVATNYTTNQFSAFLFLGAGTGVDLNAWKQSFFGLLGLLDEQIAATTASISGVFNQLSASDFIITPNFKLPKTYNYGDSFTLKVISQNIPNPSIATYCYTYSIMDEKSKVIASFSDRTSPISQLPTINKSSINIVLPKRNYVITSATFLVSITIFSPTAPYLKDINLSFTFKAINSNQVINSNITNNSNTTTNSNQANSAPSRAVISKPTSANGSPLRTSATLDNQSTTVLVSNGNSLEVNLSDLSNTTTNVYHFTTINQIPITVNNDNLPVTLCFDFVGAITYKLITDTTWTTIALPACTVFSLAGKYEYSLQGADGLWSAISFIQIGNSGATPIC